MTSDLLLIAAGGLAREAVTALRAAGRGQQLRGLLDDDPTKAGSFVADLPVLGGIDSVIAYPGADIVLCAGKGTARRAIARRLEALGVGAERHATIIDPSVNVPTSCTVGAGSILLAGVVLTADVSIGRGVVCMPHVTLTHDDVLEDFATLAAGATLGGGVRIGEAAYLGMNCSVRERLTIGADAVLGMGSVLLTDQPSGTIWAGVPARALERHEEPQ